MKPATVSETCVFRVGHDTGLAAYLLGDFEDPGTISTRVTMYPAGAGAWEAIVRLPVGTYHYRFMVVERPVRLSGAEASSLWISRQATLTVEAGGGVRHLEARRRRPDWHRATVADPPAPEQQSRAAARMDRDGGLTAGGRRRRQVGGGG
jgi:hypothetical protein